MVRRLVEAINGGDEGAAVEELFAPRAARRVRRLFAEFRAAFPDWHEEVVQLVAEGAAEPRARQRPGWRLREAGEAARIYR